MNLHTTATTNWQPSTLMNDFIILEPLKHTDFDRLYSVASDPLIWEQHPSKERYKKDVFEKFFNSGIESKTAFLIIDKLTNEVIGSTRYYDFLPEQNSIAIGYTFIGRKYWGGIYNSMCKKLLLDYAFTFVTKVFFHVGIENLRSQKAVLKLGAQKVREFEFESNGVLLPYLEFELLKTTYTNK